MGTTTIALKYPTKDHHARSPGFTLVQQLLWNVTREMGEAAMGTHIVSVNWCEDMELALMTVPLLPLGPLLCGLSLELEERGLVDKAFAAPA